MRRAALLLMLLPVLPAAAQEPPSRPSWWSRRADRRSAGRSSHSARVGPAGCPASTIIAAARYPANRPHHPPGRHARAHARSAPGQVPARCGERRGGHGDPGRGVGRAAHRPHRGQGLRVRPRAAGRARRRVARRLGVFALSPVAELGDAWGADADRDLSPHRQARHLHGSSRVAARRAARGRVTLSGDIAGTLVTDAAGPARAPGVSGQEHGRAPGRVAPLPQVVTTTTRSRWLRRNLKPGRRGARIRARPRPIPQGPRP